MLTLGEVELCLSGAIGGLLSGGIDTALRRLDGQPRAQARAKRRTEALARRVMRDRAIRILAGRGLSVRAIAADLHVGRGTVRRCRTVRATALDPGRCAVAQAVAGFDDADADPDRLRTGRDVWRCGPALSDWMRAFDRSAEVEPVRVVLAGETAEIEP